MKKSLKTILIIILAIIVVAAIICGGYFLTIKLQEKSALKAVDSMFTALKTGNEEEIKQYINIEEVENEGNNEKENNEEEESAESFIDDEEMAKAMMQHLNYEVISTDTKINNCTVKLNVSNKDFKTTIENYITQAFSLAISSAFGGMTDEEMNAKMEEYFVGQFNSEDLQTMTNEVTLNMKKENGKWDMDYDKDQLLNAIMPGYSEVMKSLEQMGD